ncbi:hypothetical protein [Rhizobium sp. 768_B6_N1_8]|uniref:hypothetical protein n=1 Tax=unclassified Rhizobium TaxID=2613769 RepID=UPI003F2483D4
MTPAITLWLTFVLATGAVGWFGTKRQAVVFAIIAVLTVPATLLTLGHAAPWQPDGKFTVLGARIDVDEAIYVMLDHSPEPRLYKLPYSAKTANELQKALDNAENGGTVNVEMGGSGGPGFAYESPNHEVPKQTEPQAIIGGGN